MNRHFPALAIVAAGVAVLGCDRDSDAPDEPKPIEASLAYKPLPPGSTFRARVEATSRLPEQPTKRELKERGQVRAIETTTSVESTFYVELLEDRGSREKWRIDFENFERVRQREGAPRAVSTHALPDRAFIIETTPDQVTVTDKDGGVVTNSQRRFVTALVKGLRNRAAWGQFFADRDFPRGKIVEAPGGLLLGGFAEALLGDVLEANTTVSLFRMGLESGSEVAHFDVHSRRKLAGSDGAKANYLDLQEEGRAVVRVVDSFVLSYETRAKVTPRAETGRMLPTGSGSWEMRFAVDAESLQMAD